MVVPLVGKLGELMVEKMVLLMVDLSVECWAEKLVALLVASKAGVLVDCLVG